ncbi:MAG TPA: SDR family oxidoreductase [Burkholderiaceae bacterium]|jgi:NAD(P)-dependent dehydrogenase (short-subunit alcohol dehydrogenase family)|nr:SDR family oxidoreductase [Burkholderiaceae bacterium]
MVDNNEGAVMLITGGSRGIGAATARLGAERGWRIVLSYRDDRRAADQVVQSITAQGGQAVAVQADVGREDDVLGLFAALDAQGGRLRALVNNAGIVAPAARVDTFDLERLERVFRTNVIGSFLCAREAVRRMSTRHGGQGGAIVNLSSVAARMGSPSEYVDYAASKGAIDTMTLGLAKEVATEGIRVNAVRPGLILTDIHASGGDAGRVERLLGQVPMRRAGSAEEVAQSIVWLCSSQANYVTGAVLDVGGGR